MKLRAGHLVRGLVVGALVIVGGAVPSPAAEAIVAPSARVCFSVAGSPGDAAIVNLTPVQASGPGFGLLVSSNVKNPPVASNVNFNGPASVDPNVAVGVIGNDGKVCFVNSELSSVDLVADHLGTIDGDAYTPAKPDGTPDRKADTRNDPAPAGLFEEGNTGRSPEIAVASNGNPVIGFFDYTNGIQLKVATCNDPGCASASVSIVDTIDRIPGSLSMTLGATGNPVLAYDYSAGPVFAGSPPVGFRIAACTNSTCTSATLTTLDQVSRVGYGPSVAIGANGNPVVSYVDDANDEVKVAACSNPTCTASSIHTVDDTGFIGLYSASIAIGADGNPILSYARGNRLKVSSCSNSTCSASTGVVVDTDPVIGGVHSTSIVEGPNGLPVVAYVDGTNDRLVAAACDDSACATAVNSILDDGISAFEAHIVLGADGKPVIGYVMDLQMRVAACDDATCSDAAVTTLDSDGRMFDPDIAIGANGNPVAVYHENSNADLRFVRCASATCK